MTKRKEHKTEPQALSRATAVIGGRAFVTVLLTSVVAIAVNARQPKLVVGIMVDGLKQEYIDLLRTQFVKGGFNRFLTEGVVLENVDYGTNLDPAAATAVVMTGASPAVNGIPGAMRYDPLAKRLYSTVHDPAAVGNYTDETYSPRGLRVSTLSDESRIAGAGVTYVYSIAPGPEQAVIMGGHSGNGVAWLNTRTGNWATSTFYHDFPQVLNQRNRTTPLSTRIQTMEWTPSLVGAGAEFLPEHLTHYPFRYTFAAGDMERFAAFRSSPLVNTEITQIATELINTLKLGTHDDLSAFLQVANLTFNATATIDRNDMQMVNVARVVFQVSCNLQTKFTRRTQNDSLRALVVRPYLLQNGKTESSGFSCSGLRQGNDVISDAQ